MSFIPPLLWCLPYRRSWVGCPAPLSAFAEPFALISHSRTLQQALRSRLSRVATRCCFKWALFPLRRPHKRFCSTDSRLQRAPPSWPRALGFLICSLSRKEALLPALYVPRGIRIGSLCVPCWLDTFYRQNLPLPVRMRGPSLLGLLRMKNGGKSTSNRCVLHRGCSVWRCSDSYDCYLSQILSRNNWQLSLAGGMRLRHPVTSSTNITPEPPSYGRPKLLLGLSKKPMHCLDGRNRPSLRRTYAEECGPRNMRGPRDRLRGSCSTFQAPSWMGSTFFRRNDRPHPPSPVLSFERERVPPLPNPLTPRDSICASLSRDAVCRETLSRARA